MKALILSIMYPDKENENLGIFVQKEVEALSKYCECRVISPRPWKPFGFKLNSLKSQSNIKVYYPKYFPLPGRIFLSVKGFWLFIFLHGLAKKIRKEFNFDVIHAHRVYPEGFIAVLLSALLKKPVVISIRGSDINQMPGDFLVKKLIIYALSRARMIVTVSRALKDKVEALGAPESKIKIMPKGVDIFQFKPVNIIEARKITGLPQGRIIILYVGNLVELKNPLSLVDVALEMSLREKRDFQFVIIGEGKLRKRMEALINENGLSDKFMFTGSLEHSRIPVWMNSADIFIIPSVSEGMPNVLYEAMASGLPIIATKVGGIPEIIEDGKTGILVDPGSIRQLAENIQALVENNRLAEQLKANSRFFMEKNRLTWDENSLKIISFYKEVLHLN